MRNGIINGNKILIEFDHGLGDNVQLTSVIQNIKKVNPNIKIDIKTTVGKYSIFDGICNNVIKNNISRTELNSYDFIYRLYWHECHHSYIDVPSTKVEKCLKETFGIEPDISLSKYYIKTTPKSLEYAKSYFRELGVQQRESDGKFKVMLLHYQGNTSTDKKNLNHDIALLICHKAIQIGFTPIILDWDFRSPLIDNKKIFCPDRNNKIWNDVGTGDGERIAALISLSSLFIGIDSGPGHIAGSTNTDTIIIWTKHHPINYYCIADNVFHLVPHNHKSFIHANKEYSIKVFNQYYKHGLYTNLGKNILEVLDKYGAKNMDDQINSNDNYQLVGDIYIRKDNAEQDMVIVRDIMYNDSYRLGIIPGIVQQSKLVVDVGAHIGCFARLFHTLNARAKIECVEVCPENIDLLTKNVSNFANVNQAACTYSNKELMLLNAVRPNCESTGGSVVVEKSENYEHLKQEGYAYWKDERRIEKITLEQILDKYPGQIIDLLKLDCESSELDILDNTSSLDKIRFIVGEYHNRNKWHELLSKKFQRWDYGEMYLNENTNMGIFHLSNHIYFK